MWLYLEGDLISAPRGSDLLKHRYTEPDLEEGCRPVQSTVSNWSTSSRRAFRLRIAAGGVWHVLNDRVADLLANLLKLKAAPNIRLFPKGALVG